MMITLAIFILLAAAVFGILTGVLQSTSSLQDNQDRRDRVSALDAFLKKELGEMPATATLVSYARGTGEGLTQNGIIFGTATRATVIDAKVQANGYYVLRLAVATTGGGDGPLQDARQILQQDVTGEDSTLAWTPLVTDIKMLDWKFQDGNVALPQWVDLWNAPNKPNLVEFSLQPAGDLQPSTMDFWIPKLNPISVNVAAHAP